MSQASHLIRSTLSGVTGLIAAVDSRESELEHLRRQLAEKKATVAMSMQDIMNSTSYNNNNQHRYDNSNGVDDDFSTKFSTIMQDLHKLRRDHENKTSSEIHSNSSSNNKNLYSNSRMPLIAQASRLCASNKLSVQEMDSCIQVLARGTDDEVASIASRFAALESGISSNVNNTRVTSYVPQATPSIFTASVFPTPLTVHSPAITSPSPATILFQQPIHQQQQQQGFTTQLGAMQSSAAPRLGSTRASSPPPRGSASRTLSPSITHAASNGSSSSSSTTTPSRRGGGSLGPRSSNRNISTTPTTPSRPNIFASSSASSSSYSSTTPNAVASAAIAATVLASAQVDAIETMLSESPLSSSNVLSHTSLHAGYPSPRRVEPVIVLPTVTMMPMQSLSNSISNISNNSTSVPPSGSLRRPLSPPRSPPLIRATSPQPISIPATSSNRSPLRNMHRIEPPQQHYQQQMYQPPQPPPSSSSFSSPGKEIEMLRLRARLRELEAQEAALQAFTRLMATKN